MLNIEVQGDPLDPGRAKLELSGTGDSRILVLNDNHICGIIHTRVAHADPVVHDVAEDGHDNAEQGQENPVLADFSKGVSPDEGDET